MESRILWFTSLGHMLCHICELAFIGLIPTIVVETGISVDQVAAIAVPGFLLYGFGALPAGIWTDRRGSVEALTVYFLLVAIAGLGIYASQSLGQLKVGVTLLGLAISIYHPAGLAMLSLGCRNRGRALGINGVAGSLGVAIGPSLGIAVVGANFSWRLTYLLIALLAFVGFAAAFLLKIQVPAPKAARTPAGGHRGVGFKLLVVLFAAMLVGGFNYRCLTTALPAYLSGTGDVRMLAEQDLGSDGQAAEDAAATTGRLAPSTRGGGIVFLIFALGGIGQLAGGLLADRFRPTVLYALTIGMSVPLVVIMPRLTHSAGIWVAGVLAVFVFAQQPSENSIVAEATPPELRSTMYGLKFVLAFGLASFGAWVAGIIWQHHGLLRVFDLYGVCAAVMCTLAFAFHLLTRHKIAAPAA